MPMEKVRLDAMHVLEQVFNVINERLFYEKAKASLQSIAEKRVSDQARIKTEKSAFNEARIKKQSAEQRAAEFTTETDRYRAILSRPVMEIAEENENQKLRCEQLQESLLSWMVGKMQCEALALEFGNALGISVEQFLNERRSGPCIRLTRATIKPR
jgi:hypothetical protein